MNFHTSEWINFLLTFLGMTSTGLLVLSIFYLGQLIYLEIKLRMLFRKIKERIPGIKTRFGFLKFKYNLKKYTCKEA